MAIVVLVQQGVALVGNVHPVGNEMTRISYFGRLNGRKAFVSMCKSLHSTANVLVQHTSAHVPGIGKVMSSKSTARMLSSEK